MNKAATGMVEPPHLVITGVGLQIYDTQATSELERSHRKRIHAPKTEAKETEKEKKRTGQSRAARVRKMKTAGQGSRPHDLSRNGPGRSAGTRETPNQTSLAVSGGNMWRKSVKVTTPRRRQKNEKHSLAHA
jgi:hypothetical protein